MKKNIYNIEKTKEHYLSTKNCLNNRSTNKAIKLREEMKEEAIRVYENRIKQRFQATNYKLSMVINTKPDTTMRDLKKIADYLNEEYKFQCYQIVIHKNKVFRDDKEGIDYKNHAFLNLITLDKNTGKSQRRKISLYQFRNIENKIKSIIYKESKDKKIGRLKEKNRVGLTLNQNKILEEGKTL